jgi:hypothetical protein
MNWITICHPGYLGKQRDRMAAQWDAEHGAGRWRIAYEWMGDTIDRAMALQLYEDGYYEFFRSTAPILNWLICSASDVYDTAPSNMGQLDYFNQETPNNHIHDVAIRRSVLRLGRKFIGEAPMHVRWKDTPGYPVNPGVVPFHMPKLIRQGEVADHGGKGIWWNAGTIEDFYQRNKVLQVVG